MRTFTVNGNIENVDDVMLGIPSCYRDEFIGANFDNYNSLSLCLAHADTARQAKIIGSWKYEDELKAMREYLK